MDNDLMLDKKFLEKRIDEQNTYIQNLFKRNISAVRRLELVKSATSQLKYFYKHLAAEKDWTTIKVLAASAKVGKHWSVLKLFHQMLTEVKYLMDIIPSENYTNIVLYFLSHSV